jgi:NADH-quinone oxidoreductase subunit A
MGMDAQSHIWPLLLYAAAILVLIAVMIGIPVLVAPRHREPATGDPFESGVVAVGTARLRFSVKFYLIAMFFVIFDLEAVYLFAWAIALRDVGWTGYGGVVVFIAALLAALVYLWRIGALDWGPTHHRRAPSVQSLRSR